MCEDFLSEQELRRLSFLPENQVLPKQNDADWVSYGLKSIFETDIKRHSEPRLPSTAQINH